jgi:Fe-S-cluster containining protein
LNFAIAEITLNLETKRITNIVLLKKDLRFKCQRCAVFCCRLGGPRLNDKDFQRLRQAGYGNKNYMRNTGKKGDKGKFLNEKEDGSCIFLEESDEIKEHMCVIYDFRPSLCKLYPFEFTSTGPNMGVLKIIPCCNGLNAIDGELIDKKFVEKNLFEAIVDHLDALSVAR